MARINLQGVVVDFPIVNAASQSFQLRSAGTRRHRS
jgi:hypothetical protein